MYGAAKFKGDNMEHEVALTEALIPWIRKGVKIERPVKEHPLPDAILHLGDKILIELDRGTMNRKQIIARVKKYEGVTDLVVWIVPTRRRMKWLRKLTEPIAKTAVFSTYCWCWHLWWDFDGTPVVVAGGTE